MGLSLWIAKHTFTFSDLDEPWMVPKNLLSRRLGWMGFLFLRTICSCNCSFRLWSKLVPNSFQSSHPNGTYWPLVVLFPMSVLFIVMWLFSFRYLSPKERTQWAEQMELAPGETLILLARLPYDSWWHSLRCSQRWRHHWVFFLINSLLSHKYGHASGLAWWPEKSK